MMNPPKREPRHDCLFEVACRLDGQTLTGIGLDVSRGGIFIDSKEKFAVGKVLELEFRLEEDDPKPIYCRGAVTWINERPDPIKPNYPNGFGVCFLELESATEKLIVDFLGPAIADLPDEDEIDS
jgi:Tfp pilus assembly protein PilZ